MVATRYAGAPGSATLQEAAMGNSLCHFELMTNDVAKCRAFYSALFGWKDDPRALANDQAIGSK